MCEILCQPRLTTAIRSEWRMANAWSYPPNGTICEEANWGQADAGRAAVRTDATLAPPARSRRRASTSVELRIGRGAGRSARARRRASISARTSNRSRGPPKRRSADPARGRTTTTRRHANHQPVQRRRPPLVAISPRGASSCHGPSSAALGWDKGIRREAAPPNRAPKHRRPAPMRVAPDSLPRPASDALQPRHGRGAEAGSSSGTLSGSARVLAGPALQEMGAVATNKRRAVAYDPGLRRGETSLYPVATYGLRPRMCRPPRRLDSSGGRTGTVSGRRASLSGGRATRV